MAVFLGSPIGGQLLTHCHKTFVGLQVFTGAAMPMSSFIFLITKLQLGRDILAKV